MNSTPPTENNSGKQADAFYVNHKPTWRDTIRYHLLPFVHCDLPKAPSHWKDCLINKVRIDVSLADRLRILFTGKVTIETKTVTENKIGGCIANSVMRAGRTD